MKLYTIKPLVWTDYDCSPGTNDCWASGVSCVEYSIEYDDSVPYNDTMFLSVYEHGELTYQSESTEDIYALRAEANKNHRTKLYKHVFPEPGTDYFSIKPLFFEGGGEGTLEAKGIGGEFYEDLIYRIEKLDEDAYTLTVISSGYGNEEIASYMGGASKEELLEIASQFNEKMVSEYLTEAEQNHDNV